jgi:hypothetical protein
MTKKKDEKTRMATAEEMKELNTAKEMKELKITTTVSNDETYFQERLREEKEAVMAQRAEELEIGTEFLVETSELSGVSLVSTCTIFLETNAGSDAEDHIIVCNAARAILAAQPRH